MDGNQNLWPPKADIYCKTFILPRDNRTGLQYTNYIIRTQKWRPIVYTSACRQCSISMRARLKQYEFSMSMRLINVFRDKALWFAAGISRSWARSLLLAWLTGGKRWCLGFLRMSANICLSAKSQICANDGWLFGRNPPFTAFFNTFSSPSRPWASSRPHHTWDVYVSLAMKVARVTSHSGGPLNPWCFKVPSAYIVWAPRTTNWSTCMVNERLHWKMTPRIFILSTRSIPRRGGGDAVLVLGHLMIISLDLSTFNIRLLLDSHVEI